jgi:UDP-glucose 4-epimerase
MSDAPKRPLSVVAVTGSRTFLGTELLRALSDDPSVDKIIAIDQGEPDVISDKLSFYPIDLSNPSAGVELARILRNEKPDTFIHGAFHRSPTHDPILSHEVEDVGTMHVLDACAQTQPERFLLLSSTLVYGANAKNPNYLSEEAPLTNATKTNFVKNKVNAEEQVLRFARNHQSIDVCSLRFAPILGPRIVNLYTRLFSRPVVPTVAGKDPLMQVVHEQDAVRAALLALRKSARGVFNIVGRDVLPYSTLLALLGRLPFPMPAPFASIAGRVLWTMRLSEVPGTMLDHLRYLCVADGRKAQEILDFEPEFDIRQTLYDFLGMPESSQTETTARYGYIH